jgi:hypothetical protein
MGWALIDSNWINWGLVLDWFKFLEDAGLNPMNTAPDVTP